MNPITKLFGLDSADYASCRTDLIVDTLPLTRSLDALDHVEQVARSIMREREQQQYPGFDCLINLKDKTFMQRRKDSLYRSRSPKSVRIESERARVVDAVTLPRSIEDQAP